jgi:serine/threonine-protein kinase
VILYELLAGRRPYPSKDPVELLVQIRTQEFPSPRKVRRDIDRDLEAVVLKCLEKEPKKRYETAAALADDLERWLKGEPTKARPARWGVRATRLVRRRRHLVGGLLLLLCMVGFVRLMLWKPTQQQSVQPQDTNSKDSDLGRKQQALDLIQTRLRSGKEVVLLGKTGLPDWYLWRTDPNRPPLDSTDGPLVVESYNDDLLELLPDPLNESYRFSIEVRHIQSINGSVGLFLLADQHTTPGGREDRYCAFTFADRGHNQGKMELSVARLAKTNGNREFAQLDLPRTSARRTFGDWHLLEVLVTPQRFVASFDGALVGEVRRRDSEPLIFQWWQGLGATSPTPPLLPSGALGLYIQSSIASFRNVTLRPLTTPRP